MYFEFQCAKCSKKLKVREENIGGKVRCPHCHHTQVVERPSAVDNDSPFNFVLNEPAAGSGPPSIQASGPAPSAPAAPHPAVGGHHKASSATEVSPWLSAVVGLGLFVVIYAVLFPFRSSYIGGLFWERGWVQFAETLLFSWSMAILFFKWRKLDLQQDSVLFDLLPSDISKDITVKSVEKFARHIQGLPVQPSESFLVNRVVRGLEHFRLLKNSSEVSSRLATQSDIDANSVDSSYALVKIFVWAIPILGFIGTVMGIGDAVGGFSTTMQSAGDIGKLKESFNLVTGGLATAFDTTLLALVLSIFIMFPMTSLLKSEQDLLNSVDEYCNENLLKRLKDESSPGAATGIDPKVLQAAIDAALTPHHAELKAWSRKLEGMGEALGQQISQSWTKADEQIQSRHAQVVKQLQKTTDAVGEVAERLKAMSDKQAATMTELAERTIQTQTDVGQSLETTASSVQRYFEALESGLGSLNQVLSDLGQKQVVVQMTTVPRARWSLFGRRNNGV